MNNNGIITLLKKVDEHNLDAEKYDRRRRYKKIYAQIKEKCTLYIRVNARESIFYNYVFRLSMDFLL
jgi:hypothetical protein